MAQQINLFNPVFLRQKKYFSAVTMIQAIGLLAAGIFAFFGYTVYQTSTLARIAADAARQLEAQREQLARVTREFSPLGRSRILEDELTRSEARLKQREEILRLLETGGLGNAEGFSRYLTAFARQTVGGVWITGFTIGGDEGELQLNGRVLHADLIPSYLRALSREDVMRGRHVADLRLTAREERAAPGVAEAVTPLKFVEFSLSAPRSAGTPRPAAQPSASLRRPDEGAKAGK